MKPTDGGKICLPPALVKSLGFRSDIVNLFPTANCTMAYFTWLMAGSVLAYAAATDWTTGDVGVDHMYNDLDSFSMTTNTTVECYNACQSADSCVAWVVAPSGACGTVATCWLKTAVGNMTFNPCRISGVLASAVLPAAFNTLPVGSIHPQGWMQDELSIQANGLSGYLFYFWPDIQNSTWIGGDADGGLHERGPYWLNGIVPLAFQTHNVNVTSQMDVYINYILASQLPSGWLGPDDMPTDGNEYWSRFNVIQSFIQYWEPTQVGSFFFCVGSRIDY
jgi:hypothetical protein